MKEKHNKQTGLTEQQEQAARLLVGGMDFDECANTLGIGLDLLHSWQPKVTFKAYFNRLQADRQQHARQFLPSLYKEALEAMRECLKSDNQAVKLKTAMFLIDKLDKKQIGETDAREILKAECTYKNTLGLDFDLPHFHDKQYKLLLKENNLE